MQQYSIILNQVLEHFPQVGLAYLFGSRVEGRQGPDSDHDFAVLLDSAEMGPKLRSALSSAFARQLGTDRVDVLVLNSAPIELAFSVISRGALLYERDVETRVEYEARIMGRYFDELPLLRAAYREIAGDAHHAARAQRYREALGRAQGSFGQIGAPPGEKAE